MIVDSAAGRKSLLARSRTIAVVGASNKHERASYVVFSYLRTFGRYEIAAINPTLEEIDGARAYPDLAAYAAERGAPDIVDVFRRSEEAPAVARDAVAVGAKAIWFQYGVINDEAIRIADEAGLDVVVDRCLKVETARFSGGLAIAGINTGNISARRL